MGGWSFVGRFLRGVTLQLFSPFAIPAQFLTVGVKLSYFVVSMKITEIWNKEVEYPGIPLIFKSNN